MHVTNRINGVDLERLSATIDHVSADPTLARFQFRARNDWVDGGYSRSTIKDFYGAGQEDSTRPHGFTIDAGEPAVLLGSDTGPNPAEALLHALAACLTTSLVYVATARKVRLTAVESTLEGDMTIDSAWVTTLQLPPALSSVVDSTAKPRPRATLPPKSVTLGASSVM